VVLVEDATDAVADALRAGLADWRAGDAQIVVTAGALGGGSALRKAFEAARNAVAVGIYNDPPGRDEVEAALRRAGLRGGEAMGALEALARTLDPGDFAQFLEKLALYKRGDADRLSEADVAACAPSAAEAELDEVLALAAEGEAARLAAAFRAAGARGGSATTLTIAAGRYFRTLYTAACASDPEAALARARPPVFGPRRTRMAAQARALGPEQLERALGLIVEAELTLRSSRPVPAAALAERLFVRIAALRGER
jgi:DNA polymerase-3 subunit delta